MSEKAQTELVQKSEGSVRAGFTLGVRREVECRWTTKVLRLGGRSVSKSQPTGRSSTKAPRAFVERASGKGKEFEPHWRIASH